MSKVWARWLPRMLTNDHERTRLDISRYILSRYADDPGDFIERDEGDILPKIFPLLITEMVYLNSARNSIRRSVLTPADKAANSVVVVWKKYYINTLKQELSTAYTYEHNRLDETSVVDKHRYHMAA